MQSIPWGVVISDEFRNQLYEIFGREQLIEMFQKTSLFLWSRGVAHTDFYYEVDEPLEIKTYMSGELLGNKAVVVHELGHVFHSYFKPNMTAEVAQDRAEACALLAELYLYQILREDEGVPATELVRFENRFALWDKFLRGSSAKEIALKVWENQRKEGGSYPSWVNEIMKGHFDE